MRAAIQSISITLLVLLAGNQLLAQAINATGTILDAATRQPLPGINISVASFSAAISDENGRFTIKVPSYTSTLQLSGAGFQSKEVPLRGNATVTVQLFDESYDPFYDQTITTRGAWNRNLETPDNYIQGLANGLTITRRSGTPNMGSNLFMRGLSSLYATNKPLIVVDGMIYENTDFGGSIINHFYSNPLSLIDIKDIDNITVLKDGSSLYGTK